MNDDERFIELWNDYLEGELDEAGIAELRALVEADDRLLQSAADSYQTHRLLGLVAQEGVWQQDDFVQETLARLPADADHFVDGVMRHLPSREDTTARTRVAKWPLAVAVAAVIALIVSLYLQGREGGGAVVKITGLSGSLLWTGNGGRVVHDLDLGRVLPGGTIECVAPDSWIELEFNDGSTVTVMGNSVLTLSDLDQKELHLKGGKLACDVRPQPGGRPMLVHTRSAMLEVLGTQFEVEAGPSSTVLDVSQGVVRLKRLSDGNTVDVPARHRAIADADRDVAAVLVPDSVSHWKSQLHRGPDGTQGKWSPGTAEEDARLRAVPFTTRLGKTIYTTSVGVSRGDKPPVILQPASRFRVRGHIASSHKVYFGVTVRHPNGEFAGNFQTIRPAVEFQGGQDFEVTVHLRDFRLDPSLIEMKNKLPSVPFQLVVESMWCHTLDEPAGLEVTEVELQSPANDESE